MSAPSTSAPDKFHVDTSGVRTAHLLRPPEWRKPDWLDGLIFFVGLPAGIAFLFSLVGIRLINGMPYWQGLTYMLIHMAIAWWCVSIGSSLVKLTFRSWRPPVIAICTLGFLVSLIPAGFMFQRLGDFYSSLFPVFAANRADNALPSWHLDYLIHFIRYSIPALPLYLAGLFGYRFFTGVDWFAYPPSSTRAASLPAETIAEPAAEAATPPAPAITIRNPVASMISGSQLPPDAKLLAVKAEQHYIMIWSDHGNDLVRYRFKDLETTLAHCNGLQVHRSWWVNLNEVRQYRNVDRKLELVINDQLAVPVSTSYKQVVFAQLGKRLQLPVA